jgi:hypothetical protein
MPFFYSQYLKDDKKKSGKKPPPSPQRRTQQTASSSSQRQQQRPSATASRLVWHSNTGASGLRKPSPRANFNKYTLEGKKTVHFSTIEVQRFHFDWTLADDVFYTRKELTQMGSARFDDAALLRKQRNLDCDKNKEGEVTHATDDVDIAKKSTAKCINALLATALEDPDLDDDTSIRGIEHFVYPELQQEMIRKKKEVQKEVLEFVRSKRPDPQGWRLAQHSRLHSQWARDVALEKGRAARMKQMNDEVGEGEEQSNGLSSPLSATSSGTSHSLHMLTCSASFSAASFCEESKGDVNGGGLSESENGKMSNSVGGVDAADDAAVAVSAESNEDEVEIKFEGMSLKSNSSGEGSFTPQTAGDVATEH